MPIGTSQPLFYSPSSLLKHHSLPIAAYLRTQTQPPGLDLSRPILLYSHYQSTKVRATSLRLHRDATLSLVGPSLVVPDTYSGWFSVITPEGKSAPIFSSVEEVVAGKLTFFLTRHDVTAFSVNEDDSGKITCHRVSVPSGHVLKLLGVIQDLEFRQNSNSNGHWLHRSSPQDGAKEEKFAQCLNFKNEIVYLPLTARGRFYATAQKSSKNTNKVFLVPQIIKNFKLPLTVKLMCGHIPRVSCAFTGLLRLERSYQEEVILACTMTSGASATLFEIEVDSNFLLRPVVDDFFSKSPVYLKTISYCQDESDLWQRQIKVTHHVTEKRARSLTRSLSDKFVEPLSSSPKSLNLSFLSELNPRKTSKDWNSPYKSKFWDAFNDKENKKKIEKKTRRLSKQNTYVFQNIKRQASQQSINLSTNSTNSRMNCRLSQSVDNLESPTFVGEVASISDDRGSDFDDENTEDHYSVIGEPPFKREKSLARNSKGTIPSGSTSETCTSTWKSQTEKTATFSNSSESKDKMLILTDSFETKPHLETRVSNDDSISEGESVSVISVQLSESEDAYSKLNHQGESIGAIEDSNKAKVSNENGDIREKLPTIEPYNDVIKGCDSCMDQLSQTTRKESKGGIQMRGNTVVIKVKDFDYGKPISISNNNESPSHDEDITMPSEESLSKHKKIPQILDGDIHVFKSTIEFKIGADDSIEYSSDSKTSKDCLDTLCQESNIMTPSVRDLERNSVSENNHSKIIDGDNSSSKLPEVANSLNSGIKASLKEGVSQETDDNSKTSATNKESAVYKMGVDSDSLDTLQSSDNKTYFCITHDIPKNHILHTVDLTTLKYKEILQELTKSIENSKLNPIFLIKNDGNVTFDTCTEEDVLVNSPECPGNGAFEFRNVLKEDSIDEGIVRASVSSVPMMYDVTQNAVYGTEYQNESDSAISVSSEEQESDDVTHV